MITVTLTLNPAVDVSTRAKRVAANRKLRCRAARYDPGGGGINVSMAMGQLGFPSTAVFPCGGSSGETIRHLLRRRGRQHDCRDSGRPLAGLRCS